MMTGRITSCPQLLQVLAGLAARSGKLRRTLSTGIPSPAAVLHFSALAFIRTHNFDEFVKLILFKSFIMAEPLDRRPTRSRKPIVHFDDKIAQSSVLKKPKALTKPAKPAKPTKKPLKPPILPTPASPLTESIVSDDINKELCSQTEGLDIKDDLKAKKKAKVTEIARLNCTWFTRRYRRSKASKGRPI